MEHARTAKVHDDLVLPSLWNCIAFMEGSLPKLSNVKLELVAPFRRRGGDVTGTHSSDKRLLARGRHEASNKMMEEGHNG